MTDEHDARVDEDLYSRQLFVLGHDAMRRMMKSRVLVIGLDGLGQEICKNLCLAGVKRIAMWDDHEVALRDLGAGFYLREEAIGKRRDSSVLPFLSGLNKYVEVGVAESPDPDGYDVVVSVNQPVGYNLRLGDECHEKRIKFVIANVSGLFMQIFVDFGEHTCTDRDGEQANVGVINDITEDGVLTVADGSRHRLSSGGSVRIGKSVYKVDVISKHQFRLEGYKGHAGEKDFEEMKEAVEMVFASFRDALAAPKIVSFGDEEKSRLMHRLFSCQAQERELACDEKKKVCVGKPEQCDATSVGHSSVISQFNKTRGALIAPMCSIAGGFAAQEVLKGISGKFMPLDQFFYFDCSNAYSNEDTETRDIDRYYDMRLLFGSKGLEQLMRTRVFLVGAGAIGCEHLKNFVMTGMGQRGAVVVTDMDSIEQSNLNRQFLFREADVQKLKSEAAPGRARELNEDYCRNTRLGLGQPGAEGIITSFNMAVGVETEETFSDEFFAGVDVIANALDNVEARNYMDSRAVAMRLPLVDSGTLGTKGHVQVVVPFVTESYSSTVDAAENSIPMCTVKSYPSTIEHTIEWAMGEFRRRFFDEVEMLRDYLAEGKDGQPRQQEEADENDKEVPPTPEALLEDAPRSVEGCIKAALSRFVNLFSTQIQNLLSTFPADYLTKEGFLFWSPPKRIPSPISFNINDKLHILFVESCANLYAAAFGVRKVTRNEVYAYLENVLSLCEPSPIHFDDVPSDLAHLTPLVYDKDTWHADFIYSAANLRARNYKIKEQSKLFVKGVSGKIIPAIATTTAVVSGLATMEIIKYRLEKLIHKEGDQPHCQMKNAFLDLGMPFMVHSDPMPPAKMSYKKGDGTEVEYTLWSRMELEDDTLENIISKASEKYGKSVSMVSAGSKIIYWDYSDKYKENFPRTISDLCGRKKGQCILYLDLITDDDEDVEPLAIIFK